jgi:hypothetical protein
MLSLHRLTSSILLQLLFCTQAYSLLLYSCRFLTVLLQLTAIPLPLTPCTPAAYCLTPTAYCFSFGILLTYIDAAWTQKYRKHISYDCSPLALWLDLQKTHVTWLLSTVMWHHWSCISYMDTKKTLFQYCLPHVCCGHCLAMDLHVTMLCS